MLCSLVLPFDLQDTFPRSSIVAVQLTKRLMACTVVQPPLTGKIRYDHQWSSLASPWHIRGGSRLQAIQGVD